MASYEIVHIAIAPPDLLAADLVNKVAVIINKDLYGTRLLLSGKIPRVVAHYQTFQAAESAAQSLRRLGLVSIVCQDSELRKLSLTGFRAHSLMLGQGEVTFCTKGGEARTIKAENVFLILNGITQTRTEKEVTTTKMKFSLTSTLLTGVPIQHKVKEKTMGTSVENEYFIRLYDRKSSEPDVEIFQYNFDYSFLGKKMAPSSLVNLNTTVTELRNTFPQAVFDDRLTKVFQVDAPSGVVGDDTEVNCKLIYLYYQALGGLGPSA
jgi:hypothetical protein